MSKIYVIILFLFILVVIIFGFGTHKFSFTNNTISPYCSGEAKQCPDGSFVVKTGPNCEFALCPQMNYLLSVGDKFNCPTDAKKCPEGYYVGRSLPDCEFVCEQ